MTSHMTKLWMLLVLIELTIARQPTSRFRKLCQEVLTVHGYNLRLFMD